MTTLARTRAETLFTSITAHAGCAIEPPAMPPEHMIKPRLPGPNTLHLPGDTLPNRTGWPKARTRRFQKTSGLN